MQLILFTSSNLKRQIHNIQLSIEFEANKKKKRSSFIRMQQCEKYYFKRVFLRPNLLCSIVIIIS